MQSHKLPQKEKIIGLSYLPAWNRNLIEKMEDNSSADPHLNNHRPGTLSSSLLRAKTHPRLFAEPWIRLILDEYALPQICNQTDFPELRWRTVCNASATQL